MPPLSEELTALLDSDGSPDRAARMIADTLPLRVEVERALPALQHAATAKAGEEGVKAVIGKRLALFPQPQRDDGEWNAWWSDYFDTLEDVPLSSLEAAMRAYVALPDSEFMPKPGRLRELAFLTPCRSLQRFQRAKRALQMAEGPPPPIETPRAKPEEVKALLEVFKEKSAAGAKRLAVLPSIAGKADEGGITPEMRKLIARRNGAA